jgi:hypothetical protein
VLALFPNEQARARAEVGISACMHACICIYMHAWTVFWGTLLARAARLIFNFVSTSFPFQTLYMYVYIYM